MSTYAVFRNGAKANEEGILRPLRKLLSVLGVATASDLVVTQRGAGANKSVDISVGDAFFDYNFYAYFAWNTATVNDSSTVITDNTSGNPRIDTVVAYIDLTVIDNTNSNNPGALKFMVVAGTPAGSPSAPSSPTIQSAVGSGNPFIKLANVAVANGFTSIVNANITDVRPLTSLGIALPNTYVGTDHIILQPATNKLVKLAVLRQNNTSNVYENNTVELTGWGFITAGASDDALEEAVTFGITFSAPPIVTISMIGSKSSDPSNINDFSSGQDMRIARPFAYNIGTTGFTAAVYSYITSSKFTNGQKLGYAWRATGVL